MEMQDAETLGEGNSSFGISTSLGLNTSELFLDSMKALKFETTSWAPIETHFKTGIGENFDFGVSLWNSSLLSAFRFQNNTSYYDIGANVNFKFRMTPPLSVRNVAVQIGFIGQVAGREKGDDYWKYTTYGVAPGIIYSRTLRSNDTPDSGLVHKYIGHYIKSLYAGLKTYFLFTDVRTFTVAVPIEKQILEYPIIYDAYVGVSVEYEKFTHLELHGVFVKDPHDGTIELIPHLGLGTKILF